MPQTRGYVLDCLYSKPPVPVACSQLRYAELRTARIGGNQSLRHRVSPLFPLLFFVVLAIGLGAGICTKWPILAIALAPSVLITAALFLTDWDFTVDLSSRGILPAGVALRLYRRTCGITPGSQASECHPNVCLNPSQVLERQTGGTRAAQIRLQGL